MVLLIIIQCKMGLRTESINFYTQEIFFFQFQQMATINQLIILPLLAHFNLSVTISLSPPLCYPWCILDEFELGAWQWEVYTSF